MHRVVWRKGQQPMAVGLSFQSPACIRRARFLHQWFAMGYAHVEGAG